MTTRRNLVITFLQKHLQMLIGAATVVVLARLISPEETGIFSIGVAVTALTHAVRDFGVGNFLIKEPQPSEQKTRTAFTISLLIAVGLSAVLLAVAGPTARFYEQPKVATIIRITTFGLLISPLSTVALALLMREHRFADMFRISLAGSLAGTAVSLSGAWTGLGATALALGALANSLGLVVAANLVRPAWGDYVPCLVHWRPIWRFGVQSMLSGVAEQIGGRAGDLVIGKALGFGAVGLLSRSGALITMFQESVLASTSPVVMASMAGDARRGAGVSALLLTSVEYASVVAWPFFAVLAIFAHDAVLVLFGSQWLAAAPYTSILCAGAALAVLPSFSSLATTATGRVDLLARYNLASQGLRVALVALGSLWGLGAVAWLLVLAAVLQGILAHTVLHRAVSVSLADLATRCWRSLAVGALVAAAMLPVDRLVSGPPIERLAIVAATATPIWLASMLAVRHPAGRLLRGAMAHAIDRLAPRQYRRP